MKFILLLVLALAITFVQSRGIPQTYYKGQFVNRFSRTDGFGGLTMEQFNAILSSQFDRKEPSFALSLHDIDVLSTQKRIQYRQISWCFLARFDMTLSSWINNKALKRFGA